MTPESEIKRYTIPEFAKRIRSKYPVYKDLDDDELTKRVLAKHPNYRAHIDPITQVEAEAAVARSKTQFENAQQAYQSAAGKKLNPKVTPGTEYFRPLTSVEQAAKKKGDPVIISEASQQPVIAPEQATRPRKVMEPPVSLAPVIQGRLSEIQKQRRQQETQAKVEQARQVMKRRPGLIAQMEQAGVIQRPNPNQLIDKTIPKVGENLPSRSMTFGEDRAQRVAKKQAIGELQQEAKKRGIRTAEIRAGVKAELSRPETYSDQYGTRQRMSVPDPARVEAETISRTQAAIAEHDRKQRVSKMGTLEYAAQLPKGPLLGLASGASTSLKAVAVAAKKAVDVSLNLQGLDASKITPDTKDTYVYKLGEYIEKNSRAILRSNPDLEKEFFIGKAPEALGQSALFLLGGAVSKSPKLAVSILGGTMTAGDAYDEVRARGGTDDEAINAGLLAGAILGPTELIGTRGLIKALEGKVQAATLKAALKNAMITGSKEGLENTVQEIGQETGQGLITGNPRTLAQLAEAGALATIAGSVGTGATTLGASGIDALRNRPATPDIVTEYLKASPLTTPEELAEIEKPSTPSTVEPEQVTPVSRPKEAVSSTLDLKPEMRTEKPSISAPSMGKPQQIQLDQIAAVRTPETAQNTTETIAAPEAPSTENVRLYRADVSDATEARGSGWANSLDYVSEKYGAGQMGGTESVWYIDVPKRSLDDAYGDWRAVGITSTEDLQRNGITVEPQLYRRVKEPVPTTKPTVETPAELKTQPTATESQLTTPKEVAEVATRKAVADKFVSSETQKQATPRLEAPKAEQVSPKATTKEPLQLNKQEAKAYPLADRGDWYSNADYEARGGRLVDMSPDEFLAQAKPLEMDEVARDNIDDLKRHVESGRTLDPAALYADGKTDGRHRAYVAKELGIQSIPVIDFRAEPPQIAPSDDIVELSAEFGQLANEPELAPGEKETETKQSRLAKGVEARAIEAKLTTGFQGLPEYETIKVADQARMAADLLRNDPEQAKRVAMGQSLPSGGLLPESVFVALENQALKDGDVELLRELATTSTLSAEATGMGQRIRMLGERDPYSPVTAMREIQTVRESRAKKKMGTKAKEKVIVEIKTEVRKHAPKAKDWKSFLTEIACK